MQFDLLKTEDIDKNGDWRIEDENQSKAHQTDISTAQNNEVGRPFEP